MPSFYLLQEDGTSKVLLETSGAVLLETSADPVDASFIASVTTLYAPVFNGNLLMPFITAGRIDTFPISEDFLGNSAEYENGSGQDYDDFTLASEKSAPAVYPPELPEVNVPFIASATVVYPPLVPEVHADFIASATTVYAAVVALTNEITVTIPGTYLWLCPAGITQVAVECFGGAGAGAHGSATQGGGGGGGGAFARGNTIPVTPGTVYTFVVGGQAGDSSFTGDSGNQVVAKGGASAGTPPNHGAGGSAASSTGDIKFSGGDGGDGAFGAGNKNGGGGGASGNIVATGNSGAAGTSGSPGAGGVGANGGGNGGSGGNQGSDNAVAGSAPGGAGGGGGGVGSGQPGKAGANGQVAISLGVHPSFIASATVVYTPSLPEVFAPFISSSTVVYTPTVSGAAIVAPSFISSATVVYTPTLPEVTVSFISSITVVYAVDVSQTVLGELEFIDSVTQLYLPTLMQTFTGGGVSQVTLEVAAGLTDGDGLVSQVTLEIVVPQYKDLHIWQTS